MASAVDILAARILIVDDKEANVLLLEQLLRAAGYHNLTATRDPYAVCALHRAHHFDLILLDLQMPGMDGFAVMKDLKACETQGYAPILAITVQPDHKLRALASGAKDFIAKPFDLAEIKTRIHNLLEVRLLYKQLEHSNRELESFALHDELTQLPNRRLLLDRLKQARLSSARTRRHCALMFMDVDHFKQINDSLGHDVGDELLQQVSARLLKSAREGDSVARFGGDEFVLLLDGLSTHAAQAAVQAEGMAHKMHDVLSQSYSLHHHDYEASFSIGMVIFVGDAEPIAELLKKADLAMYQVKADGRNGVRFFDPVMQAQAQAHDLLTKELHRALARQEFEVYYQVQVNAQGQPTGAQALLRWNHPLQGVLCPSDFTELAENSGMQQPLGQWLLERACRQLHAWAQDPQTAGWSVAVSLADCQLAQIDCVSQVTTALQSANANPHLLMLGLSERALAVDPSDAIVKMNVLRDCGVRFSLDDFGSAWPALSHLQLLPLDQLKLSRSLVSNLQQQTSDAVMVQSIVAVAASLKLQVLAQGVDSATQRDLLLTMGCGAFQGDLFGAAASLSQLLGKFTENLPLALIPSA